MSQSDPGSYTMTANPAEIHRTFPQGESGEWRQDTSLCLDGFLKDKLLSFTPSALLISIQETGNKDICSEGEGSCVTLRGRGSKTLK